MRTLCLLILLSVLTSGARADRDVSRTGARAIASANGEYFMFVVPVSDQKISWLWTVYSMGESGAFKEVWSRGGLNFRELFLSDDGRYVVCVNTWPTGHATKREPVIAIYDEGALVRSYHADELVRDVDSMQHSVSHFRWTKDWPPVLLRGHTLYFTNIENDLFEIDIKTGAIRRSMQ
jgi:hypothetical protein